MGEERNEAHIRSQRCPKCGNPMTPTYGYKRRRPRPFCVKCGTGSEYLRKLLGWER